MKIILAKYTRIVIVVVSILIIWILCSTFCLYSNCTSSTTYNLKPGGKKRKINVFKLDPPPVVEHTLSPHPPPYVSNFKHLPQTPDHTLKYDKPFSSSIIPKANNEMPASDIKENPLYRIPPDDLKFITLQEQLKQLPRIE